MGVKTSFSLSESSVMHLNIVVPFDTQNDVTCDHVLLNIFFLNL